MISTVSSPEFGEACEELQWNDRAKTPHRSGTIGIADRVVRRLKEGTLSDLLQPGLDEQWWVESMECNCCLRNVPVFSDGKIHKNDVLKKFSEVQSYQSERRSNTIR